jgi:threonylcarbamoyladenosine tRNA methylthiotransferase MtaB
MKRRHLRDDAIRFCAEARRLRPDMVFGADLIAGFPTETDAMFEQSLAIVDECGLAHLHVFPFSPRRGTPAARMPQLDRAIVKERAARLREKGEAARLEAYRADIGRTRSVLVERPGHGHTEHFAPVEIAAEDAGAIVAAEIVSASPRGLTATPVREAA